MGSTCVVGLQWGDEAKGKIVDLLCDQHDLVVRYQGGANAGHTVVADGQKYKLSLVPTGILRPHVTCVIANGVVVHPQSLLQEIDNLVPRGIDLSQRMLISDRAHVILPYHIVEERLTEESASAADHLGTTRRGIGPCYRDKVGRVHGIRVGDLLDPVRFRELLGRVIPFKNRLLSALLPDFQPFDLDAVEAEYLHLGQRLAPFVTDTTAYLHDVLKQGKRIMFEGAQGSLLDIDHGSFPYVTSSNSSSAGLAAGSGVPARYVDRWIGIVKSYTTRVGGGPFPTEQDNEIGEQIRQAGNEYGTVTGRPRRCGWFDSVAVRYSAQISGATEIVITLLDVLSGHDRVQVSVAYEDAQGRRIDRLPSQLSTWAQCRPVYEWLPGWSEDISQAQEWSDLPAAAQNYVRFLSEQVGTRVSMVSVGPDRRQTIMVP